MNELCRMSASELAPLIKQRHLSPVELTRAFLDRIESVNAVVQAYLHVCGERALAEAKAAEAEIVAGRYRGPLHGIPVAYKDVFHVKGLPTTAHSRIMEGFVATEDSGIAARLQAAGVVTLGKLNTTEFATGSMDVWGRANNPWDLDRVPGGSSAGSAAALASHLTVLAIGSDTGGSIRIPAAFCGVIGFKPTFGRVSRTGILLLSWSLDHPGPMTKTARDAALMMQAMAGYDPQDTSSVNRPVPDYAQALEADLRGRRLGVPRNYFFERLDPQIGHLVEEALQTLRSLGAELVPIELPLVECAHSVAWTLSTTEAYSLHRKRLTERTQEYGQTFRNRLATVALMDAEDYVTAQRAREVIVASFEAALRDVDAIVSPTVPYPAYRNDEFQAMLQDVSRLTRPANLSGQPSISVPCGFTTGGLPAGLMITGRAWDDAGVLAIADAYQQATTWHRRMAPLQAGPATATPPGVIQSLTTSEINAAWVASMAKAKGQNWIEESSYEAVATLLAPIKERLDIARASLVGTDEPAVRRPE